MVSSINHFIFKTTCIFLFIVAGSGSAANLALAAALSSLLETSNYPTYKYRIRFCWWGAEEL
ncbi:unnamed protein product, partial [Rotaria magnacalcarata]